MANRKANLQESIKSVRMRLWLLLLRGFGVVVLLIVALFLAATLVVLGRQTNRNPYYRAPLAYLLMSYYQGRGSWQGVAGLLERQDGLDIPYLRRTWDHSRLLDASGVLLVENGRGDGEGIGMEYPLQPGEARVALVSGGQAVGYLIIEQSRSFSPFGFGQELILPLTGVSLLLGLLTVVIGMLLMRRVVEPLAEVITAAQSVAGGDFAARVPLHQHRDDLYALSASFNQMAASLQQSDEQRRAMLADVAHELRTPLSILRGRLEGIVDGIYTADPAHIAPALEEVYLLDCLVDDLRLLTLAEAGKLEMEPRAFDLGELAEKVVNTFEAEAVEHEIRLCAELSGQERGVLADPQRVEQVISNLIANALRYVPAGGCITVSVEARAHSVALVVTDDGPGVAEADLPYLFDRFWRGEKSRGRATGGAGLGLAIAKQLIEAMDGEIWALNRSPHGLEVGFTLPAPA